MNLAFYKNKSFIFELMEKQLIKLFIAASDVLNECIEGDISGNVKFSLSYMTLDKEYTAEFSHPADYDSNEAGQLYLHMLSVFNMNKDLLQDSIIKNFSIEWDIIADNDENLPNKILLNMVFTSDAYSIHLNGSKEAVFDLRFVDDPGKSELEKFCNSLTEDFLQTGN